MNSRIDFLTPEQSCLLVIDPQERLMAAIHQADRVIDNTVILIHCARTLAMPVLATTQYEKGLGPFVPKLDQILNDTPRVDKTEFNSFANPGFKKLLAGLDKRVDTMILAGAETHICIYQSALGALNNGYHVWVAADAVSSRKKRASRLGLERLRTIGAAVGPTEMIVYELLQQAGTKAFKSMLPHLK
ncbi:MAG: isochorismatase family protein [Desulfobacterales bacterium]|nr:isochorismatase family protein [Desulfobacterales bacterium]